MAISRSDMERQLRKDGGILTLEDAKRMAPPGESLAYINPDEAALLKSLGGAGEDINGTGIKSYFIKKLVRKATTLPRKLIKTAKKVAKSPVGKAAILGALTFGIPGTQFSGLMGAGKGGLGSFFGSGSFNPLKTGFGYKSGLAKTLGKFGLAEGTKLTGLGKLATTAGLSGLAGLLAKGAVDEEDEIDFDKLDRGEGLNILDIVARARKNDPEFRFLPGTEFTDTYAEGGNVGSSAMNEEGVDQKFVSDEAGALPKKGGGVTPNDMGKLKQSDFDSEEDYQRYLRQLNRIGKAEGGTIKDFEKFMKERMEMEKNMNQKRLMEDFKQYMNRKKPVEAKEGGIMDLGGMEMDLRGGGFVPLGAKEKADDVPARLSKNEFVMTADAVRAAGGGSVDKGADKMYNMMKNLEAQV